MSHVKHFQEYINEMKCIQNMFQDFFDDIPNEDEILEKIIQELTKHNILQDYQKIVSFLRFISISTNHYHRYPTFFKKITNFLLKIKDQIHNHLTNFEIFMIFKKNKLLLLYLFEEKIIIPDEEISKIIMFQKYQNKSYPQFFWPEFKSFFSEFHNDKISNELKEQNLDDITLEQRRKIGHNDHYICQIIRDDSIENFIAHINRSNIPLTEEIEFSIFETNPLFLKKRPTMIEYALFYGSIRIVTYLIQNGVTLNSTDWLYAIHSNDPEIIELFETRKIEPPLFKSKKNILKESIKCYHNKITQYILENYFGEEIEELNNIYLNSMKYYNYSFYPNDFTKFNMFSLIELKNSTLCEIYFNENKVDINQTFKENIEIDDFVHVKSGYPEFKEIDKTALIKCIEVNNYDFLKFLISRKEIDLFKSDINPLFYAIQQNNPEIAQLLLTLKEIDINIESTNKFKKKISKYIERRKKEGLLITNGERMRTPLSYAIEKNNSDIAKLLIQRNEININYLCKCQYYESTGYAHYSLYNYTKSYLFLAIENDNIEIVHSLLSKSNIDINYESFYDIEKYFHRIRNSLRWHDTYKKTALFLAVEKENYEIVKLLLSNENVDVNCLCSLEYDPAHHIKEEKTPLLMAVAKQNIEIIRLLLANNKIDVNCVGNYIDDYFNIDEMENYNKDEKINTALSIAIQNQNIEIIKLLLQKNIDMNKKLIYKNTKDDINQIIDEKTYLEIAIENENLEIVNLLLKNNKIDINLISSYCNVKQKNKNIIIQSDKKTKNALNVCIEKGKVDMLKILLERKDLNVNAKTCNTVKTRNEFLVEKNALELSVNHNNLEFVKLLLERKDIEVNMLLFRKIKNEIVNKHTVLHTAVEKKNEDIIQLLLTKEAVDKYIEVKKDS